MSSLKPRFDANVPPTIFAIYLGVYATLSLILPSSAFSARRLAVFLPDRSLNLHQNGCSLASYHKPSLNRVPCLFFHHLLFHPRSRPRAKLLYEWRYCKAKFKIRHTAFLKPGQPDDRHHLPYGILALHSTVVGQVSCIFI